MKGALPSLGMFHADCNKSYFTWTQENMNAVRQTYFYVSSVRFRVLAHRVITIFLHYWYSQSIFYNF
ncbi:unnamed protein product [Haemonchus placei]|uniref:Uncharacterized protein n=1 Tax=Haemonchus placei TaxID=6290 RepID=A0A0N4X6J9_HAEPC|nr:unnamed protein product [Haemonchus placei]